MKPAIFTLLFSLNAFAFFAQIPNGNFEEWGIVNNIESPIHWQTNNYYPLATPVDKVEDAIEGNYSMKVSSTAFWLPGPLSGCAHVKLLPQQIYKYMAASVRIDSIGTVGEVAIRVKQRAADGLYEQIGKWESTSITAGIIQITFPIAQTQLDTLLIEVWALNTQIPFGSLGYSEVVIDNLRLTTTVAANQVFSSESLQWALSPNPAKDWVSVRLGQTLAAPCRLRLLDLSGRVLQEHGFNGFSATTLDLHGLQKGIYILEMRVEERLVQCSMIVVNK